MADPVEPVAQPSRPSQRLRLLLIASLALNLLVLGVVVGSFLNEDRRKGPDRSIRQLGVGPFERALTADDLAALGPDLRARRPGLRASSRNLRGSLVEATEALRSVPFDPARFEAALQQHVSAVAGIQKQGFEILSMHVARMSDAERAAFADRIVANMKARKGPRAPRD